MGNFRERLARFMSGRYGMDPLNNAATVLALALFIVNTLVQSPIIGALTWAVMIAVILRTYSRNTARRSLENDRFMKLWKPVGRKLSHASRRVREVKTHRFRTCPRCRALIRMPRKKGTRQIQCPRCSNEFETRISF